MGVKAQHLCEAFVAGRCSRRDFLSRLAATGLGIAAAHMLLGEATTRALAAGDFDWRRFAGRTVKLLLNKHPYTDAMLANLDQFKALTGLEVAADVFPEEVYFDELAATVSTRNSQYDAFLTGPYMTWTYGPAGALEDLKPFLADPARTAPTYDWEGIYPHLRSATAWNGVPGAPLGTPDAKQWGLPWGWEMSSLTYNRRMFDTLHLSPPDTLPQLLETALRVQKDGGGPYGCGVRGSRSWTTIDAGFMSAYRNYGLTDFTVSDAGKLVPAMATPESKTFHRAWVDLIRQVGPRNWSTTDWYKVGSDLGAGESAMIFDADIIGYFANGGSYREAGHLGFHPLKPNPEADAPTPNMWVWSLALSAYSRQKEATWLWMQWASSLEHGLYGARYKDFVNPVRRAVAEDADWRSRLALEDIGYAAQLERCMPGAAVHFTPQPLFFEVGTRWAEALQQMVAGEVPVDEGLEALANRLGQQLKEAGLG